MEERKLGAMLPTLVSFCPTSKKLPVQYLFLGSHQEALAFVRARRGLPEYRKGGWTMSGACPETVAQYAHLRAAG